MISEKIYNKVQLIVFTPLAKQIMAQPSHSSCLLGPNSLGNCLSCFYSILQLYLDSARRKAWEGWSGVGRLLSDLSADTVPADLDLVVSALFPMACRWYLLPCCRLGWSELLKYYFSNFEDYAGLSIMYSIYLGAQFQKIGNFDHTRARLTRSKVPFPKNHKDLNNVYIFFKFAKTFHILQRTIAKNII